MQGYGDRALVVLAVIAIVFLLHFGAPFFIPLLVALMIAYALAPVVDLVTRVVRWRVVSATVVIAAVLGLVGLAAHAWSDDIESLWERIPVAARAISKSLQRAAQEPANPVAEVKKAAEEIESLGQGRAGARRAAPAAPPPALSVWQLLWTGGKGITVAAMQVTVVIFLVFFMLASGDLFKRKLVRIFGATLSEKKNTVQVIEEIDSQIRKYLWVMVVSNGLVGIGTWLALRLMGVSYAELWGVGAFIIHTVPYVGPAVIALGTLLAAFLQFGTWSQAFLVSGVTVAIATLVGSVFQTWLASRESQMNTTATFIGLLFFGWLWGLWGVLLAIPLLAIVKTVCDHKEEWRPVGELLSN